MMRQWTLLAVTIAGLAPVLATPAAAAGECRRAARAEYADCKATCKEDFQTAKDACHNRDHACVEVCRAQRSECVDATGIQADLQACEDARDAAVATCKSLYASGTPERDQCIDNAQVQAFVCRDTARELNKPELKACRQAFRACVMACPPGAGPVVSPAECQVAAKTAYKACLAECREDYQIAKDACRNRDHECVEQCRSDRHDCRAPILVELAADVAACNATRDAAIQTCRDDNPPDSPELDACIDQAQVVAFQCRDQAREEAKPGLHGCRVDFRSCVLACPPPA
jgi:hypothetical protein